MARKTDEELKVIAENINRVYSEVKAIQEEVFKLDVDDSKGLKHYKTVMEDVGNLHDQSCLLNTWLGK